MAKSTLKFLLSAFLFCSIQLQAQTKLKTLKVGDTLPDMDLKMINYKSDKASLSDFRGKFLILDFWSTWCGSCIALFPELEKLQNKFGDKLMILPVSFYKDRQHNIDFFRRKKLRGAEINLPSVVEDTLLYKLFTVSGLPHEVWVDDKGIVIQITGGKAVNEQTVRTVINGGKSKLVQKAPPPTFSNKTPLLVRGNGGPDSAFFSRSILTPYFPGISSRGLGRDITDRRTRLFIYNYNVLGLYKLVYQFYDTIPIKNLDIDYLHKRVIVESNNLVLMKKPAAGSDPEVIEDYKRNHFYCYELILPPRSKIKPAINSVIGDLNRFFNLEGTIEQREVLCFSLIRTSQKDKLASKQLGKNERVDEKMNYVLRNTPILSLVNVLNASFEMPLVTDHTGYENRVDIDVPKSAVKDLALLREALRKYDLELVPAKEKMAMLVIRDK